MERASRETWAKHVERWRDGGLTAKEYAAEAGVNAHSLSWWKWRLRAVSWVGMCGRLPQPGHRGNPEARNKHCRYSPEPVSCMGAGGVEHGCTPSKVHIMSV